MEAIQALRCDCIIDGEVVVVDDNGLASFDRLRYGSKVNHEAVLYAFDLLELEGEDFRSAPLEERKTGLKRLLGLKRRSKTTSAIHYVDHLEFDDAELVFTQACALGCEGTVSKRLGSKYVSGRSRDWIKVKNPAAPAARRLDEKVKATRRDVGGPH